MNKPDLVRADPAEVYQVVCRCASQDPAVLQASTKRLEQLCELPGTYSVLHEIAGQRSVPLDVRKISIIKFKNDNGTKWKSRKHFTEDERNVIRARSLSFLSEEDNTFARSNDVIIAKIARKDYPDQWPSLLPDLLAIINTNLQLRYASAAVDPQSALILRRSLSVLNAVLKEFCSMKVLAGTKPASQSIQLLHEQLYEHYSKLAGYLTALNPDTVNLPQSAHDVIVAHLVFKCLSKMAVWLFSMVGKSVRLSKPALSRPGKAGGDVDYNAYTPWLNEFFRNSAIQLQALTELRINILVALHTSGARATAVASETIDRLTRHVGAFGKFFISLQKVDKGQFVDMPTCGNLVLYYWAKVSQSTEAPPEYTEESSLAVFPVRFVVQGMVLFRDSLSRWSPVRKDGTPNENVLSKEFVESAVRLLVTRFIPLKEEEIENFEETGDLSEEGESGLWEYNLRLCGERVLLTLSVQCTQFVVPLLEVTFKQITARPTVDIPSIIQKEALYCAVGRCASRLKHVIPFDQWLEHSLVPESRENGPIYSVIKRRIAWVIGKWIQDGCSPANNPKIWDVLVYLLKDQSSASAMVVSLTAANAIRECVDTNSFDENVFAPFLPQVVTQLVRLSGKVGEAEVKRRIATALNIVIERAGTRMVPLMKTVAEPIPHLWMGAIVNNGQGPEDDWQYKGSLLETVSKLIEATRGESGALNLLTVPLVEQSLSATARQHLDEDGFILWRTAMQNATSLNGTGGPSLLTLFHFALEILLDENQDLLNHTIRVTTSYILLDSPTLLQQYSVDLFRALGKSMQSALGMPTTDMVKALDFLVRLAPSVMWAGAMHQSGLFPAMLKTLIDDKAQVLVLTEHVHLFARIAVVDRVAFCNLMDAATAGQRSTPEAMWEGLMDQWWSRVDNMSEPRHRKLTTMAMASLVATGRLEVLRRLPFDILNLWIDVFGELKEARDAAQGGSDAPLTLYWDSDEAPHAYYSDLAPEAPEYARRKALFDNDPVRTTQMTAFVAQCLQDAERAVGGPQAMQVYYAQADPVLFGQLERELFGVKRS